MKFTYPATIAWLIISISELSYGGYFWTRSSFKKSLFPASRNLITNPNPLDDNHLRDQDDRFLNSREIIKKRDYPVEEHKVVTDDGYILTMFRIPFGRKSNVSIHNRPTVLIMHGFMCSSDDWLMNTAEKALPYKLADAGYDVFIGNLRGNSYSKQHIKLTTDDPEYWKFSWHEMGVYDVPRMIDYILKETGQPSMNYIGHSMGNNVLLVALTIYPHYNSKIKMFISLAPAAYVDSRGSSYKMMAALAYNEMFALDTLGHNELIITAVLSQIRRLTPPEKCDPNTEESRFCISALHTLAGVDGKQLNTTWLPVIASHFPNSASSRTFIHFLQEINSRRFQQYDYGPLGNYRHYGLYKPPEYDLRKVKIPVAIFYAEDDIIILPSDVAKLAQKLPNVVLYKAVPARSFNHIGFLYGIHADVLVYNDIIRIMNNNYF